MPSEHAKYSPSASSGWLNCTKYIEVQNKEDGKPSDASREGTDAHELSDRLLTNPGYDVDSFESEFKDDEFVDNVMEYVEFAEKFRKVAENCDGLFKSEMRVELIKDLCFGTSDIVAHAKDTLHIVDLKFGKRISVEAKKNTQLMIYGLGALKCIGYMSAKLIKDVRLHIFQPRIDDEEAHRHWIISKRDLIQWGKEVLIPTIVKTEKGNTSYTPGSKQCRWCDNKGGCRALAEQASENAGLEFANFVEPKKQIVLPDADRLSNSELQKVMEGADMLSKWLKSVPIEILNRLQRGEKVPGYKVVRKNKNRTWSSKDVAVDLEPLLGEKRVYTRKLISPAQAEKLVRKNKKKFKEVQKLIVKPEGELVVAPVSDKRLEVSVSPQDDFKNYIEG